MNLLSNNYDENHKNKNHKYKEYTHESILDKIEEQIYCQVCNDLIKYDEYIAESLELNNIQYKSKEVYEREIKEKTCYQCRDMNIKYTKNLDTECPFCGIYECNCGSNY